MPDLNTEPYRTPALLGALTGELRRQGWPKVDQLDGLIDGLLERVDRLEHELKDRERELRVMEGALQDAERQFERVREDGGW
jgi:chromosome segregation ATPase